MELIRYIHLNPLRAKLVKDLKESDKYLWTGHSVLLGNNKNPLVPEIPPAIGEDKFLAEKTVEDVLKHFGKTLKEARRRYREFVEKGIKYGRRTDLQGGGLVRPACHARSMGILKYENVEREYSTSKKQLGVKARAGRPACHVSFGSIYRKNGVKARAGRSAGGNKAGLLGRKKEAREKGDARILGSGDFVNEALSKAGEEWESQTGPRPSLKALINTVSEAFDLSSQQLKSRSRRKPIVDARSVLARVAVRNHSYKGIEIAEALSLSPSSVSRIVESGENILLCRETAFSEKEEWSFLEDED